MVRLNIAKQMLKKHEKIVKKMYQENEFEIIKLREIVKFLNKSKRKVSEG